MVGERERNFSFLKQFKILIRNLFWTKESEAVECEALSEISTSAADDDRPMMRSKLEVHFTRSYRDINSSSRIRLD
jgi:hypothetical protein